MGLCIVHKWIQHSLHKLYERCIYLWMMYNAALLKPFEVFIKRLYTKNMLSFKFVDFPKSRNYYNYLMVIWDKTMNYP